MNLVFEKKIREFKHRLLKKKYEYRQFNNANGIWLKLKIEIAISDKIFGINSDGNNEVLNKLTFIGVLSSLSKEIKFYRAKPNFYDLKILSGLNQLPADIQKILKADFDVVIFISNNN
ncbi:MAG TPA: hypothetical protein PKY81_14510 [bacterium]|nr:hypothetical protein [bacterium]HPN32160.1 hypothetical protein [bacterium]